MNPMILLSHAIAFLNLVSATAVLAAYYQIRVGNPLAHKRYMIIGIAASAVFLVFYLFYHAMVGYLPFQGEGWIRPVYFTILVTHVLLAAVIVPLVPYTAYLGHTGQLAKHRQMVRWTLPVWLYVSITGIIIYVMVYWMYQG